MGMAASQARLLALTTRMHNIELRAQNIEAQKLELAVREDEAYQKYCDALDAKKIQVGYIGELGRMSYIDANYKSVCGYHDEYSCQFSLINNKTGKVIVTPDVKDAYDRYGSDKYTFAIMMAGGGYGAFGWDDGDGPFGIGTDYPCDASFYIGIGTNTDFIDPDDFMEIHQWATTTGGYNSVNGLPVVPGWGNDLYMNEVEYLVFCDNVGRDADLAEKYSNLLLATDGEAPAGERQQLLNDFRDYLYQNYGDKIIDLMNMDKTEDFGNYHNGVYEDGYGDIPDDYYDISWGTQEVQYYMNLWDQINQAGGCETLDAQYQSGEDGTEWFNNMVNAGMISIFMLKDPEKGWQSTTLATSVGNNYLQEVNDDEKAKRAEVEYEHELKIINRKDTRFDNELKKLETEENACKTEIDSVKQIIKDNIEKNFNLFS